jgi:hypothetical protein
MMHYWYIHTKPRASVNLERHEIFYLVLILSNMIYTPSNENIRFGIVYGIVKNIVFQ